MRGVRARGAGWDWRRGGLPALTCGFSGCIVFMMYCGQINGQIADGGKNQAAIYGVIPPFGECRATRNRTQGQDHRGSAQPHTSGMFLK